METNQFIDILRAVVILGGAFLFIFLLLGWIIWWNKRASQQTQERSRQGFDSIFSARAGIVELRRAEVQRSDKFTLFKVLFEIMPADSQPAFSAVAVLEVEPSAISTMLPNIVLPVRVDRQNLRHVFPEIPGVRYSETYQHASLGIENDFQPEQTIIAAQIAPQAPKENTIYRKRSKVRIFGLPLWEVAFNLINKSGRVRYVRMAKARAIIAVGDSATGIVAIGSFAKGIVAVGQTSLGVFAFGTGTFGVFAVGLMSIGLFSAGILSGGFISFGAIVLSYISVGFLTISRYTFNLDGKSHELFSFYNILKNLSGLNDAGMKTLAETGFALLLVSSFSFLILWFIVKAILVRKLQPNDNRRES